MLIQSSRWLLDIYENDSGERKQFKHHMLTTFYVYTDSATLKNT